ncbi:MAG: FHA domain-containing protein [Coleofasciculus sp. D1-CHI-01]
MTKTSGHTTVVGTHPYLELNNQGQIQRFYLNQDTHTLGRDRTFSNLPIPPRWGVISNRHAILRKEGEDYRIFDGDGQRPSTNILAFPSRIAILSASVPLAYYYAKTPWN